VPDSENPTGHVEIGEGFKYIAADLRYYVVGLAYRDIYALARINNKQKVRTAISALVAQGRTQHERHLETGLTVGLTPEEITVFIMHQIPDTGYTRALNALKAAQKVFEEKGITVKTE